MQVSCCMSCHSGCLAKHTSGRDELHRVLNHQPGETTPQESMQIRCCFLIFLLDSLKLKKNSNDPGITKVIYAIYSTPQCFPPACSHLFLFSQAVTRALKPQGKDKVTKTEKITPNDFDFSKKLRQMTYRIWSHT